MCSIKLENLKEMKKILNSAIRPKLNQQAPMRRLKKHHKVNRESPRGLNPTQRTTHNSGSMSWINVLPTEEHTKWSAQKTYIQVTSCRLCRFYLGICMHIVHTHTHTPTNALTHARMCTQ